MPKYEDSDDFLEHHGVLGMHWGQHKAATIHPDHAAVSDLRKKPISQLSNAEIKKLNERKQLERQHKQLNPNGWNKTKSAILGGTALLGTAATLYGHWNSPGGKKVRAAGKVAYDSFRASHATSTLLRDAVKSPAASAGKKAIMLALEA